MTIAVKQGFKLASELRAAVIAADPKFQQQLAECELQLLEGKALIKGADAPSAFPLIIQEAEKSLALVTTRLTNLEKTIAKMIRDGIISGALTPIRDDSDERIAVGGWLDDLDFVSDYARIMDPIDGRNKVSRRVLLRFADSEVADFVAHLGVKLIQPIGGRGAIHNALYFAIKEAFPKGVPETMPLRVIGERIKKTAAFNTHGLSRNKLDDGSYQPTLSRVLGRTAPKKS